MNRHDILVLQQISGYPCVTITLPTHRTSPQNRQDPVRVKNLLKEATDRLLSEFDKREIDPLLVRMENLAESIDFRHVHDGLVLCVNQDVGHLFHLPYTIPERVIIDKSFFTRDLVYVMNRHLRYWTLVLSEQPTRLFEATRDDLIEIREEGFPLTHEGPGGAQPLPGGFGVQRSAYRDEQHRQFFRQVDSALRPFLVDDPLPLVVVGVDRFLSFFNEVSEHKDAIVATLNGSHDRTSPHELGKLVWPLLSDHFAEQKQTALSALDQAVGEKKYASAIGEVWHLAQQGRGKLLLVEENYHQPARLDESGMHLIPTDEATGPEMMEDAVDEIIEIVLRKQGQVVFVPDGVLEAHQRIALVLRF
ncbi:hypothetical protein GC175_08085 [bacterium]|nr:hypothetical protein [bacterium]